MNNGTWDRIRVVQYGCGKMGRIIMRYLMEQGAQVVGAIDADDSLEGMDIGELMGLPDHVGVKVMKDKETVLDTCDADIAVLALQSYMEDMQPPILECITRGINVITTSEEALFPGPLPPSSPIIWMPSASARTAPWWAAACRTFSG